MLVGKKTLGTVAYMGGVMSVPEPFMWSWSQMVEYNSDYLVEPNTKIHYDRITASYHSYARNELVKRIQGDWLLMLDTDHTFEPDILARMLLRMTNHNIQVLTALYQYKQEPYSPKLYGWNRKNKSYWMVGDWDKNVDLMEIGSAGAGCLLVKKEVFTRIEKELKEEPFDIIKPYSEDHSFFIRLKKLNIKSYCDPSIECNHLMYKSLTMDDYNKEGLKFKKYPRMGLSMKEVNYG